MVINVKLINNPEVKKTLSFFVVLFFAFIGVALLASFFSVQHFKNTIDHNNAAIVGVIADKYPDAEGDVITQILGSDEGAVLKGQAILTKYGIHSGDTFIDTKLMRSNLYRNILFYILLTVLICTAFILVTYLFMMKFYGSINEVIYYTGRIKDNDYSLDIRDNKEGAFSILKNEIYKITTMLREQAQTLEREKTSLTESIADISHQLKTPMTSLFVLNDLLYNNPPDETREEFLKRMNLQLKRIEWLVTSLLKLSKLDAGTIVMKREQVKVKSLVHKAMEPMEIPAEIKMLEINIKGGDHVKFEGDFNWTCEALINVIKNCIEHTPENGRIDISFDENPIYTEITIADNGVGIDKKDIPYIFNRFYKGKNAGDDSVGIGLAMARTIVSKQGGDIVVESEKGKGAEFIIKFYKNII